MMTGTYPKMKAIYATKAALFDFTYPHSSVYSYQTIEDMLYNHFKNYRIAAHEDDAEDIEEWKEDFAARLNEIMPRFNKLYDTWDSIQNPLRTVDIRQQISSERDVADTGTVEHEGSSENHREGSNSEQATNESDANNSHAATNYQNGNVEAEKKFSDTPQGSIQNVTDGYLTNYTKDGEARNSSSVDSANDQSHNEGQSSSQGTNEEDGTASFGNLQTNNLKRDDDFEETLTRSGYEGSAVAELMEKYRRGIDDYNSQLINAVSDFFIMIYE